MCQGWGVCPGWNYLSYSLVCYARLSFLILHALRCTMHVNILHTYLHFREKMNYEECVACRCVSVHAEVQRPAVTLAQCRLHEDTVYVGVGTERRVAMINTSLIPTHFTWSKQVHVYMYYVSCAHGAIHMFIRTTLWSKFRLAVHV